MKGAVVTLFFLLALAGAQAETFAHAKLTRSEPKAGAKLEQPPRAIELWFSEELETGFSSIEVRDAKGNRVERGEVTHSEGGKKVQVGLAELENGKYTVTWKVLSKDEHTIKGRFSFTVAAAQPLASGETTTSTAPQTTTQIAEQSPAAAPPQTSSTESEQRAVESPITWVDSLLRWLAYLSMMIVFGGFAFRLFVLNPALRRQGGEDFETEAALGAGVRRTIRLLWVGIAILLPVTLAALILQTSNVFDLSLAEALSPALLWRVIAETDFGVSWLVQAFAALTLLVIIILLSRRIRRERGGGRAFLWWLGLAAGAALLLSPSLTGHAAASAGEYRFAILSDWLHLIAGGFWVGGLFHLSLVAPAVLSQTARPRRNVIMARLISRFTRVAIPAVLLVAAAGLYNTWIHVESLSALWATPYGQTLLIKLALVVLMVILGAVNNFHFGRKAKRSEEQSGTPRGAETEKLERGFSRSLAIEVTVGVLVLLVTAALVFQTPARTHPASDGEQDARSSERERTSVISK